MLDITEIELSSAVCPERATIYRDAALSARAKVIYFHGGGLLSGTRLDLPPAHIRVFTEAGFEIAAVDYPLAPASDLNVILDDVVLTINELSEPALPFFLFGRSAGAYLCLLAAAKKPLSLQPRGIISYYGYGFLCDGWFTEPDKYYLSLPPVASSEIERLPREPHADGNLATHYSAYVYARQSGRWIDLIYRGRQKYFYLDYTLRTVESLPCPLLAAHATGDPDVPFSEFTALSELFHPARFIASRDQHDFDRDTEDPATMALLRETLGFMEGLL